MQRFALALVLALAVGAPKAQAEDVQADAAARAKAAEAAAFAAIEREHWCTAMDLFLEANGIVANADLVFNAAQAAEYAGDRSRAVQLYTELLGHAPTTARKNASKKKIKTLTARVEKDGAGPSCPPPDKQPVAQRLEAAAVPVVTPPIVAPPVVAPPVVTPPVVTPVAETVAPATGEPETTHVVVEALRPEQEPPPMAGAKVAPTWPWLTAGVGGAVAVVGGIGLAVGVGQYAGFAAAVSDQDRTDDRGSVEFANASSRRDYYSDSWNSWGAPLAITSGVVVAGGVAAAVAGGAFVVME